MTQFTNAYEDADYAEAYSKLQFAGSYYLAYRDLPEIFAKHIVGRDALDFGCGAGRSTRFLRDHGFVAAGCDISQSMIDLARQNDPEGRYEWIEPANFSPFEPGSFDLITAIFTFDNIPTLEEKMKNFVGLRALLNEDGKLVLLVTSSHLYVNEWESFSTKDFPENQTAKSGDPVRVVITTIGNATPVVDILWREEDYHQTFKQAGFKLIETYKPLADGTESYDWVSETEIAPWEIHVLGKL